MASLVTNGVFPTFTPQPISETPKTSKGCSSKLEISDKPLKSKSHNTRFLKLRADAKSIQSDFYDDLLQKLLIRDYKSKWGMNQKNDSFRILKGLSEETIRRISSRKEEPDWMLEFRLNSYHKFCQIIKSTWSDEDFQNMSYDPEPKKKPTLNIIDKLGISLNEKKRVPDHALNIIAGYRETIKESGVIFCSISEAIKEHPNLVKEYLGKAVSPDSNVNAALNSALFSDGTFVYFPKNTKCPIQISTLFRKNGMETGQLERTLIIADDRSFVQFLDSRDPPSDDANQLHVDVVELHCNEEAEIVYRTDKYYYPGDGLGLGGIRNLVTRRGLRAGRKSKISWHQVGPNPWTTFVLEGDDYVVEF